MGGDLPARALGPLLGETLEDVTVRVEVTIDSTEFHLLRAKVTGRVIDKDPEDIVRGITVSDFDQPVTIEARESP